MIRRGSQGTAESRLDMKEMYIEGSRKKIRVSVSMLSANFLKLGEEISDIVSAGSDFLHVDVMDGHFVPNITMGPCVLKNVRDITDLPLDIHLMVEKTDFFVELYADLSPRFMSIHAESEKHLHRVVQKIRRYNISPCIVLNPHTSPECLRYILEEIDMVLVMTVNPGFGGQRFIESSIGKISCVKRMIQDINPSCEIQVDGGVNDKNVTHLKKAGADIVVAGSYIFNSKDRKAAINSLKV